MSQPRRRTPAKPADAVIGAGEPAKKTEAQLRSARADKVRKKMSSQKSTVLRQAMIGLTAAAEVLNDDGKRKPNSSNSATRTWQHAVTTYTHIVPELSAGKMYVGNCLARITLRPGKRSPDGSVEDAYVGDDLAEGLSEDLTTQAGEIIQSLRSQIGGQSELLRSFGEKAFSVGEAYLLPQDSPAGMTFECLSTQELTKSDGKWVIHNGPNEDNEDVPEGIEPIRVWRPDDTYRKQATSSVRACLEVLEELVLLTKLVRSSAISRMALAGILAIAEEFDEPLDDDGEDGSEAQNPLLVDIIMNGAKAIDDPASAASWLPYLLSGPKDLIEHGIRFIEFKHDDAINVVKRREALERLAQGLDLPFEVILGHQGCVDTETECLTARGWQPYNGVVAGDQVLTLNHETGLSEWQTVEYVSHFEAHDQPMMSMEGRSHSSLSTLNHRWPVVTQRGKRRWYESETLNTNTRLLPGAPSGDLPTEAKWDDAFVELLAWYWTEGTDVPSGSAMIFQSSTANPGNVARIRRTLETLVGSPTVSMHRATRAGAYAWREDDKRPVVRFHLNKPLADSLREQAPGKVVSLDFLRSLTAAQLELFIQRSVDGDGWRHPNGSSFQLHQVDQARAEAFEFACILSGRAVTQATTRSTGGFKDSDRHLVTTRPATAHRVGFGIERNVEVYNGIVWCPTVPNATFMARRHGSVYFTGNTTFANAQVISEDTFRVHLQPMVQLFCDAITLGVLWPALANRQGIDPETVKTDGYPDKILALAVTYDATDLVSVPDKAKDIVELFTKDLTQQSVKISEVRDAVGLDGDSEVDPDEVAARLDAYRIAHIRETVQAGPSQEAPLAGTITEPGGVAVNGQAAAEGAGVTASLYLADGLANKIAGAAEITMERCAERIGNRVKPRLKGEQAASMAAVPAWQLTRTLGPTVVTQLLGDVDPVSAELGTFERTVARWAADAGQRNPGQLAKAVGLVLNATLLDRLYSEAPATIDAQALDALAAV